MTTSRLRRLVVLVRPIRLHHSREGLIVKSPRQHEWVTASQLASQFAVSRSEMIKRMRTSDLMASAHTPSQKALKQHFCVPAMRGLLLWDKERTAQALETAECGETTTDAWSTPSWLFDLLDAEYHFTLDAAAVPDNAKCKRFFTEQEDGLRQDWGRETVWCNPPWSVQVLGEWVRKAYDESRKGATVVLLVPYWKGYGWFDEYCVAQGQLRHVMGKVGFKGSNGKTTRLDCVVVVFGPGVMGYTNGPSIRKAT